LSDRYAQLRGVKVLSRSAHLSLAHQRNGAEVVEAAEVVADVADCFVQLVGQLDRRCLSVIQPREDRGS
jgi:hypothetical protein